MIFLAVSGFMNEQTFDRVVDAAKMVKSYVVVAACADKVYTAHRSTPAERRKQLKFVENGQA